MNALFIWEIASNICVTIAESYFLYSKLGLSDSKKTKLYIGTISVIALLCLFNFISLQMAVPIAPGFTIYFNRLITTSLLLILTFTVFGGSASEKILWGLTPLLLVAIADLLSLPTAAALANTSVAAASDYGNDRIVATIIFTVFIVLACFILSKTGKTKSNGIKLSIPLNVKIMLIIILVLGTMSIDILMDNLTMANDNSIYNVGEIVLCIVFLLIIYFAFFLVTRVGVLSFENIENELEVQQLKMENKYTEGIGTAIEEIRELKHDMRHHLGAIQILNASNENKEITEYLNSISNELCEISNIALTKNTLLNSIIYSKMQISKARGINFQQELSNTDDIIMSQNHISSTLGNLLDNAMDACSNMSSDNREKYINLTIVRKDSTILIKIDNSYNGIYKKVNRTQYTTTKKSEGHGLGLRHVEKIVSHYKGNLYIRPQKAVFSVTVFLPCKPIKKNL